MKAPSPPDAPVYSLALRKTLMCTLAAPAIAAFAIMLLQYKGLINLEPHGIPENYLLIGGFALIVVCVIPILITWRCPHCSTYLGKDASPRSCVKCGAQFR